jgi:hypothetical protein
VIGAEIKRTPKKADAEESFGPEDESFGPEGEFSFQFAEARQALDVEIGELSRKTLTTEGRKLLEDLRNLRAGIAKESRKIPSTTIQSLKDKIVLLKSQKLCQTILRELSDLEAEFDKILKGRKAFDEKKKALKNHWTSLCIGKQQLPMHFPPLLAKFDNGTKCIINRLNLKKTGISYFMVMEKSI